MARDGGFFGAGESTCGLFLRMACGIVPAALSIGHAQEQNVAARLLDPAEQAPVRRAAAWDAAMADAPSHLPSLVSALAAAAERGTPDADAARVVHGLALCAGRADAKARAAWTLGVTREMGGERPAELRRFLLQQLQIAGGTADFASMEPLVVDASTTAETVQALVASGDAGTGQRLTRALSRADTPAKIAVIHGLGDLRFRAALEAVKACAADPALKTAAWWAIGRMGDPSAAAFLLRAADEAAGYERHEAVAAALALAEGLETQREPGAAGGIYRHLAAGTNAGPVHVRTAAMRGLARIGDSSATDVFLDALADPQAGVRAAALDLVRALPGAHITGRLTALLRTAPPEAKASIVAVLGDRGDAAALPALLGEMGTDAHAVKTAAIEAVARMGGPQAVLPLVKELDGAPPIRAAALRGLCVVKGEECNRLIAAQLPSASSSACAGLLDALAARGARDQVSGVRRFVGSAEENVRQAALAALGRLGSEQDVGFAVEALLRQTNAALRASTAQALCALCAGARERRECLEPVLAGYRVADAETRQALVGVLPSIGGSNALSAAVAAANDPSAAVAESAVRSLVAWPGNEPLRVLLSLSASAKEPRHRVLALRGAVAMVGREAAPADAKARLYGQALAAAERADEKRLVCAGLGGLGTAAALPHLESLLSDPSVAAESALAIAAIAEKSDAVDWPAARRAVDKALGVAGTERVRREVERVGGQLAQYEDLVPAWRVCGPYSVVNLSGDRILDEVFPPERAPESVAWRDVCATGGVLTLAFGASNDHRAAYMETFCYSPTQQLARLDIGSDDGVKVWLNGKPVHSKNALRALKPGEDKVVTTLSQGWNRLVLKVTNNYLKWEACARVRTLDGRPIPGLKYSVRPDPNPPTP